MIDFFTDPWNMEVATWTLKTIFSSLIQIGIVYIILVLVIDYASKK